MSQSVTDCESRPAELPAHVVVIGLGYIGLPTAVCMATGGLTVTGVDVNPAIVEQVRRGNAPFEEPDLATALSGAVSMGHLSADTKVPAADAFIIAVPTPFTSDRTPDLSFVMTAAESVAQVLRGGEIIVLESTVPPGTTERVRDLIAAARPDLQFAHSGDDDGTGGPRDGTSVDGLHGDRRLVHLAHCPERVLPGRIMIEIATNDRVIGGLTPPCAARAAQLYRTFCRGELHLTDATSAEMVKLAENAYRDVNIAFANEIALICGELNLDVSEVISMANRHPRVSILRPGIGVGGHCIAVDPWFIIDVAPQQARLLRLAREVNDGMPSQVARQIVITARKRHARRIACLGLAFKPDVSDVRNSPAVQIVAEVARALPDTEILAVEPHHAKLPSPLDELGNVRMVTAADALSSADVAVRLVEHSAFRSLGLPGRVGQVS
jgi:UDP-N-acetyl-D-mannosaminuronic acid dehydrogenase